MRFTGTRAADKNNVAVFLDKVATVEALDLRLFDGELVELAAVQSFGDCAFDERGSGA